MYTKMRILLSMHIQYVFLSIECVTIVVYNDPMNYSRDNTFTLIFQMKTDFNNVYEYAKFATTKQINQCLQKIYCKCQQIINLQLDWLVWRTRRSTLSAATSIILANNVIVHVWNFVCNDANPRPWQHKNL